MIMRALFAAAGLLAAGLSPAFADSVTAAVAEWDATSRTITLEDRSQFADSPAKVTVPAIKSGDQITVDYLGDENGVSEITAITVNKEIAKRLLPNKRG